MWSGFIALLYRYMESQIPRVAISKSLAKTEDATSCLCEPSVWVLSQGFTYTLVPRTIRSLSFSPVSWHWRCHCPVLWILRPPGCYWRSVGPLYRCTSPLAVSWASFLPGDGGCSGSRSWPVLRAVSSHRYACRWSTRRHDKQNMFPNITLQHYIKCLLP